MKKQLFTKHIEDFTCENCGEFVKGNGFTNHCPKCLYSKHVDINPGDRDNPCKGLMKPTNFIKKNGKEYILHECIKCGTQKLNKISENDNMDVIYEILKNKAFKG